MRTLKSTGQRHTRSLLALVVALLAAALVAAFTVSPGGAAPRVLAPQPITLTFVGQVLLDEWGNFVLGAPPDFYPPVEGGYALEYTVPDGNRLVIESLYANVYEFWASDTPTLATPRADVVVGVDTFYDLGASCDYPGYQRSYDVPLVTELTMADAFEGRRAGSLQGPIFVEGGRVVTAAVVAPGGDSTMYVHIVAHGRIEPSGTNPPPPPC